MNDFDKQIKDIEEHIQLTSNVDPSLILGSVLDALQSEVLDVDSLRDMFMDFGPNESFYLEYTKLLQKIQEQKDSYLSRFLAQTGLRVNRMILPESRRIKGIKGTIRPSRRVLSKQHVDLDTWKYPLEDYLKHLNILKDKAIHIEGVRKDLGSTQFTHSLRKLTDIMVEDTLQHIANNMLKNNKIIGAGMTGIRSKDYGGDVFHSVADSTEHISDIEKRLIRSTFNKYHFELSCLISARTISQKFKIDSNQVKVLGLDPAKDYYMGTFICVATRHFNHFSDSIPSPFVHIKPLLVLFEDEGWVQYHQTDWLEIPSGLFSICYEKLSSAITEDFV